MLPEHRTQALRLFAALLDLLTDSIATDGAETAAVDPRRTYIGSEPHKLDARMHAVRTVSEWLERHGCVNFGIKRPDYRHERYRSRWVLTQSHVIVYERQRADAPHARAAWGDPVAKIPLLDVLDYFGWLHQQVGRRGPVPWPHPIDLPDKVEEIAAVASVMRASRATGPGFKKKLVWDE